MAPVLLLAWLAMGMLGAAAQIDRSLSQCDPTGAMPGYACSYNIPPIYISWSVTDYGVDYKINATTSVGWMGIGWNNQPQMIGSDAVVLSGTPFGPDIYQLNGKSPALVVNKPTLFQLVNGKFTVDKGNVFVSFSRKFNDGGQKLMKGGIINVVMAFAATPGDTKLADGHGLSNQLFYQIDLIPNAASPPPATVQSPPPTVAMSPPPAKTGALSPPSTKTLPLSPPPATMGSLSPPKISLSPPPAMAGSPPAAPAAAVLDPLCPPSDVTGYACKSSFDGTNVYWDAGATGVNFFITAPAGRGWMGIGWNTMNIADPQHPMIGADAVVLAGSPMPLIIQLVGKPPSPVYVNTTAFLPENAMVTVVNGTMNIKFTRTYGTGNVKFYKGDKIYMILAAAADYKSNVFSYHGTHRVFFPAALGPSSAPAPISPLTPAGPPGLVPSCNPSTEPGYDCQYVDPRAPNVFVNWRTTSATVDFLIKSPSGVGWVAVGWNTMPVMVGADAIIVSGTPPLPKVYTLQGRTAADIVPTKAFTFMNPGTSSDATSTTFKFSREVNTGNIQLTPGGSVWMLMAYSGDKSAVIDYHGMNKFSFLASLTPSNSSSAQVAGSPTGKAKGNGASPRMTGASVIFAALVAMSVFVFLQ